jgi:hypothetical protein
VFQNLTTSQKYVCLCCCCFQTPTVVTRWKQCSKTRNRKPETRLRTTSREGSAIFEAPGLNMNPSEHTFLSFFVLYKAPFQILQNLFREGICSCKPRNDVTSTSTLIAAHVPHASIPVKLYNRRCMLIFAKISNVQKKAACVLGGLCVFQILVSTFMCFQISAQIYSELPHVVVLLPILDYKAHLSSDFLSYHKKNPAPPPTFIVLHQKSLGTTGCSFGPENSASTKT